MHFLSPSPLPLPYAILCSLSIVGVGSGYASCLLLLLPLSFVSSLLLPRHNYAAWGWARISTKLRFLIALRIDHMQIRMSYLTEHSIELCNRINVPVFCVLCLTIELDFVERNLCIIYYI